MLSKKGVATYCLVLTTSALYAQPQTHTTYYDNGQVHSIRHIGDFNGAVMSVATDTIYYETGKVQKTIYYENRKGISPSDSGKHITLTVLHTRSFYPNGKLKMVCFFKTNSECHTHHDCGTWLEYNDRGKLTKKKHRGTCYDIKPCH
jgi:antitoxin component YwqK of YwqJK toxin-antitoxin module